MAEADESALRTRQKSLDALRAARSKFEVWARSRDEIAGRLQDLSSAFSRSSTGELEDLNAHLKVLAEEKAEKEAEINSKHHELGVRRTKVAQGQERKEFLEKRLEQLGEKRKDFIQAVAEASRDVEERWSLRVEKLLAQKEAIQWYNSRMGIRAEFSRAIKFIFTKINPANLEQEFTCTIRLDKDTNKYAMLDCVPYIKKSPDLVDDLNISNQFFEFMRQIRREFETIVEESQSKTETVDAWCSQQTALVS